MNWKILHYDVKSRYKRIFKIRKVSLIYGNFEFFFYNRKKRLIKFTKILKKLTHLFNTENNVN